MVATVLWFIYWKVGRNVMDVGLGIDDKSLEKWSFSRVGDMVFCKRCGADVTGFPSHCHECGYPYDLPEDERPKDWTRKQEAKA